MDIKLTNMENIQIRETDKFVEITPVEGYVITDWDREDIMGYNSTTMLIVPQGTDYSSYYTITVEEDELIRQEIDDIIKGML